MLQETRAPEPFGSILGYAPGGVPSYSSDYDSADEKEFSDRHAYRSFVDGVFMGMKWQCVEFARRWLYLTNGYVFDDIAMAYDIFRLRTVRRIEDDALLPLHSFRNGALRPPEPGAPPTWQRGRRSPPPDRRTAGRRRRPDCRAASI